MSACMLLAVCNAPIYIAPEEGGFPEIVTDHEVLLTRATDAALDQLVLLIRSREDGDVALFENNLDENQLTAFDEDFDTDAGITAIRRQLALLLLKDVLVEVFEQDEPGETPTLNGEITWLNVAIGEQTRVLLVSGGLSHGDDPTEVAPALYLLDALNLFDKPFVRPGTEKLEPVETAPLETEEGRALIQALEWLAARGWVPTTSADHEAVQDLVETLTDPDSFLDAFDSVDEILDAFILKNSAATPTLPASTLDTAALYALNDQVTAQLAARGWNADTEDDFDALNDLTHTIAQTQAVVEELLTTFIIANSNPA